MSKESGHEKKSLHSENVRGIEQYVQQQAALRISGYPIPLRIGNKGFDTVVEESDKQGSSPGGIQAMKTFCTEWT